MNKPKCAHCRFYVEASCHQSPPAAITANEAVPTARVVVADWPMVSPTAWCGGFVWRALRARWEAGPKINSRSAAARSELYWKVRNLWQDRGLRWPF